VKGNDVLDDVFRCCEKTLPPGEAMGKFASCGCVRYAMLILSRMVDED
jgi:hypothetical protein